MLGVVWVYLGFLFTAGGIGILFSELQGRPLNEHVPYVMFGMAIFQFLTGLVTGSCIVFTGSRHLLLQMPLQRSVLVIAMIFKRSYLLLAHLATATVVSLLLGWRPDLEALWALPALALYMVAGVGLGMLFGVATAWFRDLNELVGAVMRLAFFFTPVIWIPGSRDGSRFISFVVDWNPLSHVLFIFRNGLLGLPPDPINWIVSGSLTLLVLVLGFVLLQVFGKRLAYWL